jgi:hypothetical protein
VRPRPLRGRRRPRIRRSGVALQPSIALQPAAHAASPTARRREPAAPRCSSRLPAWWGYPEGCAGRLKLTPVGFF